MKQFFYDMIHMTEGEKLISYWWLWAILFILGVAIFFLIDFIAEWRRK